MSTTETKHDVDPRDEAVEPGPLHSRVRISPEELESSGKAFAPLASLRAHKRVGMIVALLIALLGLPVAYVKGTARYGATAVVHVSPRFLRNLQQDQELELQSNTQYRHFVQQQVRTINRYDICLRALEGLGDKASVWRLEGESLRRAAERLQGGIAVRPVPDTYLITITLTSENAAGLETVVNALVDEYLATSKSEEVYGADERVQDLLDRREELLKTTNAMVHDRSLIAQELGVTTFNGNTLNPYDQLLINSKDALAVVRKQRFEAEANLYALEREVPGGMSALEAKAWEQVYKDAGIASLKANINTRKAGILSEMSGLSDQHIGRQAGEREIENLMSGLRREEQRLFEQFRAEIEAETRAELHARRQVEEEVSAEVDAQAEKAAWFARRYNEALALSQEISRQRSQLDQIADRLDFLELETKAPGWVRLVEHARSPEIPISGGRKKLAVMFVMLGIFAGLAVPIAIDILDRRVRFPSQLLPLLGFPPLGWILERIDGKTSEFARDQMMRIVSGINRDRLRSGTRSVLMTAVKPGGGTTTLCLEFAMELERLGVRTLVVEANAFKPDRRFIAERERPGLGAIIVGSADFESAIVPGTGDLPDRVAVGDRQGSRHLAKATELKQALAGVADRYQMILIDAPPLLLSGDTELLAGQVDATILIVEGDALGGGEIKRAVRTLENAGPEAVGAIMNRVRLLKGGGYVGELIEEFQSAERKRPNKLLSPWLWK